MRKSYKSDPEYVTYKGQRYDIDTDYKTALRCLEVVDDETISDMERTLAVIYILFGFLPEDTEGLEFFLQKAQLFLQCGETTETQTNRKKDMDLFKDSDYIQASFESDYGIDLQQLGHMHWWRFMRLIGGLTETSILARIRQIRNINPNDIKDPKTKQEILEMQKELSLDDRARLTDEEIAENNRAMEAFEALLNNPIKRR